MPQLEAHNHGLQDKKSQNTMHTLTGAAAQAAGLGLLGEGLGRLDGHSLWGLPRKLMHARKTVDAHAELLPENCLHPARI